MISLQDRLVILTKDLPRGWKVKLATHCKITPPSVSGWMNGNTKKLSADTLLLAADFFKVNPAWLATGYGLMRGDAPVTQKHQQQDGANLGIQSRLALPVPPDVRARTLLAHLWRKYDAAGISMGRSHEAVVLEAVLALLGLPDQEDMQLLDADSGVLINQTRDYLSAKRAVELGLK